MAPVSRNLSGGEQAAESHLVQVLLPVPVDRAYTYESDRPLPVGSIVAVPLGPRLVIGAVWPGEPDDVSGRKLRPLERIYDAPLQFGAARAGAENGPSFARSPGT
jgi:primosomal protein N' (replication factor Y) (superfamily II helicase)